MWDLSALSRDQTCALCRGSAESFFFLLLKALLFPFGPRLGRGLQGVKKLPSGCREGLQAEALTLVGPLKAHWAPEAPSCACEPFQAVLTQPHLGTKQPAEVGQVVTHLEEFHLLLQEVTLPKVTEVGSAWVDPRPCRS